MSGQLLTQTLPPPAKPRTLGERTPRWFVIMLLVGGLLLLYVHQSDLRGITETPMVSTWVTVMISIVLSAAPFLVLGVVLSAGVSLLPASFFERLLPKNKPLSVGVAGGAGVLLPGCECATIPLSRGLMRRGVLPGVALAFALSSPAINPVVLIATSVAFPGSPEMVIARLVASLMVSIVAGLLWLKISKGNFAPRFSAGRSIETSKKAAFFGTLEHDLLQAGGLLVVGGAFAATANVLIPPRWLAIVGSDLLLAVVVLAFFAFLIAICSEADAFVAASLNGLPPTAQLAFMVVGPAIDSKLLMLHGGVFGWRFALRFAPIVFILGILAALLSGWVFL